MANLKDIQQRIKSVGSIQKVTKAMKMVAAAKVKRAQERMEISRPYSKNVQDLICRILPEISSSNIDLIEKRDVKKKGFIVITSDRGFAGSFNSSVIRLTEKEVEKFGKDNVQLFCLGKKSSEHFSRRNYNVKESFYDFWKDMNFDNASDITEKIIDSFINKEVDEIHVIYNRFRNLGSQDLMIEKVLPIDFTENYNVKNYNYDYEPSRQSTVNVLLPKHLKVQMWQQMLESYSSEEAARMVAMDNATENAKEIIKELKLEFNKARQAAITTEMLEIVGGAEALAD
ncbi:MAG: ATP synthase F1 subunit gamma [Candidatus Neomarinimicrobiota bacterium]|jgi:F-type H+-transporting ATPase subunit gamma|nr:ATP synthase F1 subunit gamma [Candidatus Neomarinimicrobiota bacterium]|tara:strand:- start:732 stop:1589 length:858 start_codon:yes stop_codon:yes gene_type:complete